MKNGDFPVRDVNVYQRVNPLWVASFFFAESSPVGQEEKIQQMERLFSPRLLGATVPRGRFAEVPRLQRPVADMESNFGSSASRRPGANSCENWAGLILFRWPQWDQLFGLFGVQNYTTVLLGAKELWLSIFHTGS